MPSKRYISSVGAVVAQPTFRCPLWVGSQATVVAVNDRYMQQMTYDVWLGNLDELAAHRKISELNKNNQDIEFSLLSICQIMADEEGYVYVNY